jgi:Zn-dependent peptidase ImmA (M78 family)
VLVKEVAREKAQSTLEAYWGEALPVDPSVIARRLGINVEVGSLPEGVSGFIRKAPERDAEIYVDADDSLQRQRFTIAHEIGHFIERTIVQDVPDEDFGFVERRGGKQTVHEFFANEYAANLLMPSDRLRAAHALDSDAIRLSARFGVSTTAMKLRLDKLGLLK